MASLPVGTYVKLNRDGRECYDRNRADKRIDPDATMIVIGGAGFDSNRWIIRVQDSRDDQKIDLYFLNHLDVLPPLLTKPAERL